MSVYVHLKHYHKESWDVKHPMFDSKDLPEVVPVKEDQLVALLDAGDKEGLTLALRSCLRHNVGRYLANWEITRPYQEEMVSEGFVGLAKFVDGAPDNLKDRTILYTAQMYINMMIEEMLNKIQSLAAPSTSQQTNLIGADKDPVYVQATTDLSDVDKAEHDSDTYKRDMYEALEKIEARDEIDAALLCPDYWGMNDKEVADALAVPRETVRDRRSRLYEEFLRLTR